MRGKLRDKRTETRRNKMSRQLMERRRGSKRESRTAVAVAWQNELLHEEDYDYLLNEDEEQLLEESKK